MNFLFRDICSEREKFFNPRTEILQLIIQKVNQYQTLTFKTLGFGLCHQYQIKYDEAEIVGLVQARANKQLSTEF